MKYELNEKLILTLTAQTREEMALVNLLADMNVRRSNCSIINAGMSFAEGRRISVSVKFIPPDTSNAASTRDVED